MAPARQNLSLLAGRPGYERNLTKPTTVLAAIDYLHHNPVRRGLVKRAVDWKWSRARYYLVDPPRQYPPCRPFTACRPNGWTQPINLPQTGTAGQASSGTCARRFQTADATGFSTHRYRDRLWT